MRFSLVKITILLFLSSTLLESENNLIIIDSLKKSIFSNIIDTIKIKNLILLSELTHELDSIKSKQYLENAKSIVKKNNLYNFYSDQLRLSVIKVRKNKSFLNLFIIEYLELNKESNTILLNFFHDLGNNLEYSGEYESALSYYNKGYQFALKSKDSNKICLFIGMIGNAYLYLADYPKATEMLLKALKMSEKLENKAMMLNNYSNLGILFEYQEDYNKALEYFSQGLNLAKEQNDSSGISSNLNNIANIYLNKSDYDIAIKYYHLAADINRKINNQIYLINNLNNIGNVYWFKGDLEKAKNYYNEGYQLSKKNKNNENIALSSANLGLSYYYKAKNDSNHRLFKSNLKKSINYLNECISIYEKIGMRNEMSSMQLVLAESNFGLGNFKDAYLIIKSAKATQDSINSTNSKKEIANLQAKRDNELKDNRIQLLETDKVAQSLRQYLAYGGVLVFFAAFFVVFIRFREKKKLSESLTNKNFEIEKQKAIVEEKNEQIISSVKYSSTIQKAILPWSSILDAAFNDYFIIFRPKDIVSGDSYWFQDVDNVRYLALVDCTGHGVPGSMLTVIANSVLHEAVLGKKLSDTAQILTFMNEKVTEILNQKLEENKIRDGMEVALIALHRDKIQFSGAGRPLYLMNGKLEVFKTDKRGIAGQANNEYYEFSSITIEKSENQILYLTSDGFADQMNEQSKKYSTKRLLETLSKISEIPLEKQKEILENEFYSHKGNREQIDDVTVIGIRI